MNPNQFQMPGASYPGKPYVAPQAQPSVVAPSAPPAQLPTYKAPSPAKTIAIVILTLTTLAFVALFAWIFVEYEDLRTDTDGKIGVAVAAAVHERELELEAHYEEEEKKPNVTFSGPEDYGNLSFKYPKTWSAYIEKDASSGSGDFVAYLNPAGVQPNPGGNDTVTAITVTIKTATQEKVQEEYDKKVSKGEMTVSIVDVNNGAAKASVYRGTVKRSLKGIVAIMKIRDKVAIIQTDSEDTFNSDFENILKTLTFNS